jgi:hypothetical protein
MRVHPACYAQRAQRPRRNKALTTDVGLAQDNLPDVDSDGEDLTAQNAIMRELREDYLRRKALAETPADSQFTNLEADSQTNDVHSVMSLIRRTNSTRPTATNTNADDGDDDETPAAGSKKTSGGAAAAAAAAAQPRSAFSALWGCGKENGGNGVAGAAPMPASHAIPKSRPKRKDDSGGGKENGGGNGVLSVGSLGRATSFLGRANSNSNHAVVQLAKSASLAGRSYVFGADNSNSGWGGGNGNGEASAAAGDGATTLSGGFRKAGLPPAGGKAEGRGAAAAAGAPGGPSLFSLLGAAKSAGAGGAAPPRVAGASVKVTALPSIR